MKKTKNIDTIISPANTKKMKPIDPVDLIIQKSIFVLSVKSKSVKTEQCFHPISKMFDI